MIGVKVLTAQIKIDIRQSIERLGYDPDLFNLDALLSPEQIRNGIIRNEYQKQREDGDKAEVLKAQFMEKCGLSYEWLNTILYTNP